GQLPAVEVNVHDVWLERHEPRHAGHLGPCLDVGPGGTLVLPDVVVAGQALVRAERLYLDRRQGRLVDVVTGYVTAGREARLVKHKRAPRPGDDPVPVTHDEVSRGLPDVVAVVEIRRMTHDALVLFIEGVHRSPGEGDPVPQHGRVARQVRVLPCSP